MERLIKVTLIIVSVVFLGLQILQLDVQAAGTRALLVLLLFLLYYVKVQDKKFFFLMFLICFAVAELLNFSSYFVKIDYEKTDYFYYVANGLYILSYIFLILRVLKDMNIRDILSKFWIHLLILTVLDVFCVNIVSGTTEKILSQSQGMLEYIYNIVIMILLTLAMINYMSKNSQKSMNFLLGAIFIFFSEVIQYAYFYISNITVLNVVCSLFLVLAFLFFYLQSRIGIEEERNSMRQDLHS
ncbi:MAG: hypothetical protein ABIO60_08945 [Aquaticitalea sp.]